MEIKNHLFEGVPGGPGSSMLPLQEVWVQSLVGEIIHATGGAKKKNQILLFSGSITFKEESKSCDRTVYNHTDISVY